MCESNQIDRIIIPPALARQITARAGQVYLRTCPCRARKQLCPPETWEVCLLFDNASPNDLQDARPITVEQALSVLETTGQRGAIYNLFYTHVGQHITELCNCCTCCCSPLNQMREEQNYSQQLRSGYLAVTDPELCIGCGTCEASCFFEARQVEDGTLQLTNERCFGCGRCISSCPEQAIRLELQAQSLTSPLIYQFTNP